MRPPAPISDAERAELRRLYRAATSGTWRVPRLPSGAALVLAGDEGSPRRVAAFDRESDAALAVAARDALPRLFREVDELRRRARGVPIVGTVR